MGKTKVKYGTVVLGMTLLLSCRQSGSPPKSTMSAEQFQSVYIALLEEGGKVKSPFPDSAQHPKSDSIFQAYGTSAEEFRSAIAAYKTDPREWQKFYESVTKKLEEKQQQKSEKQKQ